MNIVFSTTRQWNPGDEFILMGSINLLKKFYGNDSFNPIIYNRNPQIRRSRKRDVVKIIDNLVGKDMLEKFLDNSVKDRLPMDYADMVVFAGSPEWRGRRLTKLYDSIKDYKLPSIFLGIGTGANEPLEFSKKNFSSDEMDILKSAKLITCRDSNTYYGFQQMSQSHLLPCPALFSSQKEKNINKVSRIGLIYGTYKAAKGNHISYETHEYLTKLYNFILQHYSAQYEIEFVAHYIDELSEFKKEFPDQRLFYSYDSKDYIDIYGRYDLVIGHRVHGIGMSASLGIPGMMIAHDARSETVKGFLGHSISETVSFDDFQKLFEETISSIGNLNQNLLAHKAASNEIFQNLFKQALS